LFIGAIQAIKRARRRPEGSSQRPASEIEVSAVNCALNSQPSGATLFRYFWSTLSIRDVSNPKHRLFQHTLTFL